ncbi:hypothetical protein BP5796_07314 [Coleophoma crateriformis]|uniref:Ubiquitin carboxyl-terminal hydrolase n=1 Tax=Coleophoma crateriformis TaxID=565419 RepID=A0A3D8RIJ4_9HELO|nr:hypothetical protein BP5796_07314 [Coleophoma crateriformis]
MGSPRPTTPASPKTARVKSPQPGMPLYGCEHLQMFLQEPERMQNTILHYKNCLRVIFDNTPIVPQTSKTVKGHALTSLTPNYLCLQCTTTTTGQDRTIHGTETKHRFYVESKTGGLFCQMCDDFIFDPTLEELRMRKFGTGSFSTRKRKHEELFTGTDKEDPNIATNTTEASCRASGVRGIYNMGATCYMNVILQSFVHNPLLRNFYLSDGHQGSDCSYKNCMSCAMDDMFQNFYAEETTTGYSASNILASFWLSKRKAYEELASNKEQDAHEFFQFLTEELHEINGAGRPSSVEDSPASKRTKNGTEQGCNCIVHQTFYGKLQSTITCQSCGDVNTSVQSFLDLSLGLELLSKKKNVKGGLTKGAPLTLQKCLDEEYIRPEKCEYSCHNCDTQEAKKQLSIKRLPNRFKQGSSVASKIDTKVSFPLKLNMLPYTNRARSQDTRQNYELARSCTYELQSVVVHVGNLETGHYVSYSRVGNQWFKFNDHNVTLASKSQVLNEQAFLLFYVIQSLA